MRIYQDRVFTIEEECVLEADLSHRIAQVMRHRVGDELCFFNSLGDSYQAIIKHVAKRQVTVVITSKQFVSLEADASLHLVLAQAIASADKMDFIVQKATELGVSEIVPLFTTRTEVRMNAERIVSRCEHWRQVMIHASEQSGRAYVPKLHVPLLLKEYIDEAAWRSQFDAILILSPKAAMRLPKPFALSQSDLSTWDLLGNHYKMKRPRILLLIGPAGGFTEEEVRAMETAGATAIQLGSRILRTETATIVGLTLLQCYFGDLT